MGEQTVPSLTQVPESDTPSATQDMSTPAAPSTACLLVTGPAGAFSVSAGSVLLFHSTAIAIHSPITALLSQAPSSHRCQRDLSKIVGWHPQRLFSNAQAFSLYCNLAHTPPPQMPWAEQEWQVSGTSLALLCPGAMVTLLADHNTQEAWTPFFCPFNWPPGCSELAPKPYLFVMLILTSSFSG